MKVEGGNNARFSWNTLQGITENITVLFLCLFNYYTTIYGSSMIPGIRNTKMPNVPCSYYREHVTVLWFPPDTRQFFVL